MPTMGPKKKAKRDGGGGGGGGSSGGGGGGSDSGATAAQGDLSSPCAAAPSSAATPAAAPPPADEVCRVCNESSRAHGAIFNGAYEGCCLRCSREHDAALDVIAREMDRGELLPDMLAGVCLRVVNDGGGGYDEDRNANEN